MKVGGNYNCVCEACLQARNIRASECYLHLFVGFNRSNFEGDLEDFEGDLSFDSVIHWDVGFADKARYFVYRDETASMVAWYDTVNELGFK